MNYDYFSVYFLWYNENRYDVCKEFFVYLNWISFFYLIFSLLIYLNVKGYILVLCFLLILNDVI